MSNLQVTTSESPQHEMAYLDISVVVPVRNEAKFIRRTLEGLLAQDYPEEAVEILVVDGDSSDSTRSIVQSIADQDSRVRLLSNPKRLSSAARNIGSRAAFGEVVLIVDGHCHFDNDQYLKNVSSAFLRSGADCLGRPQPLDIPDGTALQHAISVARSSRLGHHPDSYIYSNGEQFVPAHSVGVAYHQRVFEIAGEFDEGFDACEDVEFNHRIDKVGLRCLLAPSISLNYHPRNSLKALWMQMARYGKGRVRLWRKHPETLSLKSFLPAIFALGLIVGLPLAAVSTPLAWIYLSVISLYLVIVLAFSAGAAVSERSPLLLLILPLVYITIHLGAGFGSLQEAIFGVRTSPDQSQCAG